jgi:hypothetical protein
LGGGEPLLAGEPELLPAGGFDPPELDELEPLVLEPLVLGLLAPDEPEPVELVEPPPPSFQYDWLPVSPPSISPCGTVVEPLPVPEPPPPEPSPVPEPDGPAPLPEAPPVPLPLPTVPALPPDSKLSVPGPDPAPAPLPSPGSPPAAVGPGQFPEPPCSPVDEPPP